MTDSAAARGRVLFVDDDAALCELVAGELAPHGFTVTTRRSAETALASLQDSAYDVVVTDLRLGRKSGIDLCQELSGRPAPLPVIVVTSYGDVESATAAVSAGAWDFLTKPFAIDDLALRVGRAVEHRRLDREVRRLRRIASDAEGRFEIVGSSAVMRRLYDIIERVAVTEAAVLITGESGTGKELVARAIHARSARRDGPFVAVNCAALPDTLLESELFGHAKGAFTGAHEARAGLMVQAGGGTLLLDEVGEMPPNMQVKLLRALQERTVRPVGSDREVAFDTRVLAATNRDLEADIGEGRFREDLYYRVNVVNVHVPPLRARENDVLLLARRFIDRYASRNGAPVAGLSALAAEQLLAYDWPGNVRELQNCIERAVVLARGREIGLADLPARLVSTATRDVDPVEPTSGGPEEILPLHEVERRHVQRVLGKVGGNKTEAARLLGLDRKTLYRKLERWTRG
jgi:two-component system response regulator HydG